MFDAKTWIDWGGLLLIFLVVYSQTGLFFCFFIPSGAFMFAAGAMIAAGSLHYNLITACLLLIIAAVLGNITGYTFGWKAGPALHSRPDGRFFKQRYVTKAENFLEKYGGPALAVGLFLPIVRTFTPIVSGMSQWELRRFVLYITVGSIGWILSFTLAGYLIGSRPYLKPYLHYIIIGIIVVVTIPVVKRIVKEFKTGRK